MKKMIKELFIYLIICCGVTLQARSQIDTSTTEKLINYILQGVDKSQVPTGYLREAGAHTYCPCKPLTGAADSRI